MEYILNFIMENGLFILLLMCGLCVIFVNKKGKVVDIFIVCTFIFALIEVMYIIPENTINKILKEAPILKREELKELNMIALEKILKKIENEKIKKIERQILICN